MNRLLVLLLSYSLVAGVESVIDAYGYQFYYFLLSATAFVMALICSKFDDEVIVLYGFLQVLMILFYICMIFPTATWAYGVLYYPSLNYSLIVFCYELFMIMTGIASVIHTIYNRVRHDGNSIRDNNKGGFEART